MMTASVQKNGLALTELLHDFCADLPDLCVYGIELDSRKIKTGDLFIAVSGSNSHGLDFLNQALINGATAIVYDPQGADDVVIQQVLAACPVPACSINDLNFKVGEIAARFYQHPSQQLRVIGITGTNGKTSCSHYIAQALSDNNSSAVIGTLGWGIPGHLQPTLNTTPDAINLQSCLASILAAGGKTVAMEVSSHGLVQGRTKGVYMVGALYTNISQDHLDYHGSMEAYFAAKLNLLQTADLQFVVVNLDDSYAQVIIAKAQEIAVRVIGFSRQTEFSGCRWDGVERVIGQDIKQQLSGISLQVSFQAQSAELKASLLGDFNVDNLLASLAVIIAMGYSLSDAVQWLSKVRAVPGRMEYFSAGHHTVQVVVDYAHTPAALENVLKSVKSLTQGRLWLVFGCGGERDQAKRAQMGRVAEALADQVIVTDDNPRNEEGHTIVEAILSGFNATDAVSVCRDREQAIISAIQQAAADDVVVVAGKGHESTQAIKGILYPFSDQQVVRKALLQCPPASEIH